MAPNTKRVFYVNNVAAQLYRDMLGRRPDIQVDKLENNNLGHGGEPDFGVGPCISVR